MRITSLLTSAILGMGVWACAATAFAQTAPNAPPPVVSTVDENGIERFHLTPQFFITDVTIGQSGAGGMSFVREYYSRGWRHNYIGTINSTGNLYTVSIGGVSRTFNKSGGIYATTQGFGFTLTYNSSTHKYTYIDKQGIVAVFNQAWTSANDVTSNEGMIESITYPSGEKLSFYYATITVCDYATGCTIPWTVRRLQSVRNSFGYLMKFSYGVNASSPMDAIYQDQWLNYSAVTGINLATDYCDPTADTCPTFSRTWPTASYSSSGNTRTVTDTIGRQTIYTYGVPGITGIRRPGSSTDDVTIAYTSNSSDAVVQSVTRNGQTWTYTSGTNEQTLFYSRARDPLNHVKELVFEPNTKLLIHEKNGAGDETTYIYDELGRITGVQLPDFTGRGYSYDDRGNVTEITSQSVTVYTAEYDGACPNPLTCNKPHWTRDAYNNQTDYTYSPTHGGVLTVTLPAPSTGAVRPVVTNTWTSLQAYYKNASGSFVASGEGVYLLTQKSSCRTAATCASGADELRTVVDFGPVNPGAANNRLPLTVTVRNGTNSLSSATTTSYDPVGNVVSVDGPLSSDTYVTHYDDLRRVIGQVGPDPDGAGPRPSVAVRTSYDTRGVPTTVETGTVAGQSISAWSGFVSLQTQSQEFDGALRPTKSTLSAGGVAYAVNQTSYDPAGRVDCVTTRMNPSSFSTLPPNACTPSVGGSFGTDRILQNSYDSADRPISVTGGIGTIDATVVQSRSFAATSGQLAWVGDGKGNKTTYEYDTFGRLWRVRYPDPNTAGSSAANDYEEFQYDLNSNVTSMRSRSGSVVTTPRDALGRISSKRLNYPNPNAEDVYFSYDNDGRMLSALYGSTTGSGIVQGYDGLGRLASRTVYGRQMGYGYDAAGHRTSLVYPDNYSMTYGYNGAGELLSIVDSNNATLATYSYDAEARVTGIARPNSVATTTTPDAISRLQSLQQDLAGAAYDSNIGLSYNPAGQIVSRTQANGAAYTWAPTPGTSDTYGVNGQNQLATFNGTSTTKDANGDLQTGFGSYSYGYDSQGQLRNATGAGNIVGVDYDPSGMLSKVTVNGAATDYLYDGPNLIAEYSGSTLVRRFVHGAGIDQPLVWFEGAATTAPKFLHTDERGSIVAVSDGTGAASSSVKYSPEGQSGTLASPFGYTGQLYIAALDLYYYKARMYSPRIGRFLQPDPSRYAGGMNLYSYANGDPVNFGDPWGLRGCVTLIALDDNGREVADPIGGCDSIDPFPTYTPAPPLPGPLWTPPPLNLSSSFASAPSFLVTPTDTCPGSGSITSVPKGRFDPRLPLVRNNTVPADAISVTGPDGRSFNAPPYADFAAAYAYGRSTRASNPFGMNSFAVQVALGHGGMYDFQRDGQVFTPAYTFASNYAVGVVMNGAGYSLEATFRIAGGFARSNSSNAGDPAQASAWTNGWNAAASGACRR